MHIADKQTPTTEFTLEASSANPLPYRPIYYYFRRDQGPQHHLDPLKVVFCPSFIRSGDVGVHTNPGASENSDSAAPDNALNGSSGWAKTCRYNGSGGDHWRGRRVGQVPRKIQEAENYEHDNHSFVERLMACSVMWVLGTSLRRTRQGWRYLSRTPGNHDVQLMPKQEVGAFVDDHSSSGGL